MTRIRKGSRIKARFFQVKKSGTYSISGSRPKVAATMVEIVGIVVRLVGDRPVDPTQVTVYIEADNGAKFAVDWKDIVEIITQ